MPAVRFLQGIQTVVDAAARARAGAIGADENSIRARNADLLDAYRRDELARKLAEDEREVLEAEAAQNIFRVYADVLAGREPFGGPAGTSGEEMRRPTATQEGIGPGAPGYRGGAPFVPWQGGGGGDALRDPRVLEALGKAPAGAAQRFLNYADLSGHRAGQRDLGERRLASLQVHREKMAALAEANTLVRQMNARTSALWAAARTPTEADAAIKQAQMSLRAAEFAARQYDPEEGMLGIAAEKTVLEQAVGAEAAAAELTAKYGSANPMQAAMIVQQRLIEAQAGAAKSLGDAEAKAAEIRTGRVDAADEPLVPSPSPTPARARSGAGQNKARLAALMAENPRRADETVEQYRERIRALFGGAP